ncbi:MAG TPA: amidohydrolase [Terriglobales bacterium]|nr:amidohydrolase [Terriglobales bacterium]
MRFRLAAVVPLFLASSLLAADAWPGKTQIDPIYPQIESLYEDLHRNPELSLHEVKTAEKMADQLRKLGFDVTTGVGGTGVVGVLKNGSGPTVMIRAELDALPVPEKTGLDYASHVVTKDDQGNDVPVMHACGHDLHMAVGIGTAMLLAQNKDRWHGTFIFVGQPAEERIRGASAMLKDGLFTRFPRPDFALSLHDTASLPAGMLGYTPGYALSNSDSVDVTIYGKGAHGSAPQDGVDPIVIAARTILAWQTIISREKSPFDPGVITVGSIHGGTKHNIIPDQVKMQLTVRSYTDEVRKHLLDSIARVAKAEAEAAGAPKPPQVDVIESVGAVYNNPELTQRVATALKKSFGDANVVQEPPGMASDDFAEYGRAGVPALQFSLGAVNPEKFAAAKKAGEQLPGPHSPFFAPDRDPSIRAGIEAETTAVLAVMGK